MKTTIAVALGLCGLMALGAAPGGRPGGGGQQGRGNMQNVPPGGGQGRGQRGQGQGNMMMGQFTTEAVILSFNLSPTGSAESLMAKSRNDVAQINFQLELEEALGKALKVGDVVEVTVALDSQGQAGRGMGPMGGPGGMGGGMGGPGGGPDGAGMGGPGMGGFDGPPGEPQTDHRVLRLISLKTADGQTFGGQGNQEIKHVEGTVKAINYDRRGVVNGAQLDSGDLVRVGPRQAAQAPFVVGNKLTADGPAITMTNGKLSLQAQQINGQDMRPQPPGGPMGGGGRGGPDGPPPGGRPDLP